MNGMCHARVKERQLQTPYHDGYRVGMIIAAIMATVAAGHHAHATFTLRIGASSSSIHVKPLQTVAVNRNPSETIGVQRFSWIAMDYDGL